MNENRVHVYKPEIKKTSIKILPKFKRVFLPHIFENLKDAIEFGIRYCPEGFRVFRQNFYEWNSPDNILLAKVNDIRKEKLFK